MRRGAAEEADHVRTAEGADHMRRGTDEGAGDMNCSITSYITNSLYTWILGVASKQLRLLHGRVGDSTILVNSLSPQMSELVEDAVAS